MQSNELVAAIARVRRAMPRNQDVMLICDAAEKAVTVKPRFDKKTYQRELMRKRRAAGKAK
jgi:hypothetical protein